RLERHDFPEMRVVGDERRHGALRHEHELGLGVAAGERAHERRGEQDIADGAEPDEEDAQHAAKQVLRCPGSPVAISLGLWRGPRPFCGWTTKWRGSPPTVAFSKPKGSPSHRRRTATTPWRCCGASPTASYCSTSRCRDGAGSS